VVKDTTLLPIILQLTGTKTESDGTCITISKTITLTTAEVLKT
jgi:hypothetical protein